MPDTMTLDDVHAEILRRAAQDGAGEYYSDAVRNELEGFNHWLWEHRPALERGMQKPLRFTIKQIGDFWATVFVGEKNQRYWRLPDLQTSRENAIEEGRKCADYLGQTAEFVEVPE